MPRRLSCVPFPASGEAFTSWLARTAEFHGLATNQMLELLGMPVGSPRLRYGVELKVPALVGLVTASGLRPRQARAMFPRQGRDWRGEPPLSWDWRGVGNRLPWMWRPRGSAVCPECLTRRPAAWKLQWRLLTVVACPEHRVYLHSWCPSCRSPIHIGTRPDHLRICPGPSADFLLSRSQDRARFAAKRACGALLEELPRNLVGDDRLLLWQHQLTERLVGTDAADADRVSPAYGRDLHMALRFAVQLGALEMLDKVVDPSVRQAFSLFQPVRDRVARTAGDGAEFQYGSLYSSRPGPMLMAAAISMVAALAEDVDKPIRAAEGIAEYCTDQVSGPEFRLLERALVGNDVFGAAAVDRIAALGGVGLGPHMGWRERLPLVADEGLMPRFGQMEVLVALGEWAMSTTSPAVAEPVEKP